MLIDANWSWLRAMAVCVNPLRAAPR